MRCILGRTLLAAALCFYALGAAADAVTDQAKALLQRNDAQAAYKLLLPLEPQRAGDPEYDYLLGIAALDAGDPERAVFALERVLALQPENLQARAEIGRAYLAMGEREAAKREFEAVRKQQIPDGVRANIDRFLSAITASEVTQITGFVEAGVGYDSNVNSSTSSTQIALPALGGIIATLDTNSTRQPDTFGMYATGANLTHKLSQEWAVVGGASLAAKVNMDDARFDTLTLTANLGGRWARGKEAITIAAQYQDFALDYNRFRDIRGLVAQWQHNYDERRQASVYGQFSELKYPTQSTRDADRGVIGVAYGLALGGAEAAVIYGSAYAGQEREQAEGVPHLGHDLAGLRVGGQKRLGEGWSAFASAAYERRSFGGPDPLFVVTREDDQIDIAVGVSYLLQPATVLVTQLAYTDSDSNVEINRFQRTVLTVSVRFNF